MVSLIFIAGAAVLAPQFSWAKSLYWSKVHVDAHLNSAGTLEVTETQSIVFEGDWNGGERFFDGAGTLHVKGVDYWDDSSSKWISMPRGRIDLTHHFDWAGDRLRWRSRQPSDPEFRNEERSYRLRYSFSHVLSAPDGKFVLDHDFGMPRRSSEIRDFKLRLTFDPQWKLDGEAPIEISHQTLAPGVSVPVYIFLESAALKPPRGPSNWLPYLLVLISIGFLLCFDHGLVVHERKTGRFVSLSKEPIDEKWLQENLFCFPPEHVAAVWDDQVGPTELLTILVRLCSEGKLQIEDLGKDPEWRRFERLVRLKRLVPVDRFVGSDRFLLDHLTMSSRDTATNVEIYEKHRADDYDRVWSSREFLERLDSEIEKSMGEKAIEAPPIRMLWVFVFMVLAKILFFISFLVLDPYPDGVFLLMVVASGFAVAPSDISASVVRDMLARPVVIRAIVGVWSAIPLLATFWVWLSMQSKGHNQDLLGVMFWAIAMVGVSGAYQSAKSGNAQKRMRLRMKFDRARRFFKKELRQPKPAILDHWAPYLVALSLTEQMEKWTQLFGENQSQEVLNHRSSRFGSLSSGQSWSGQGGAFSGAGASSSWSLMVSSVPGIGGVTGGSGSSGGRSSSGGGGGGGW